MQRSSSEVFLSLEERNNVFDVFFEKIQEMEEKIYVLWPVSNDQKLLKNILNSIRTFKISYYESRQTGDYDYDVVLLEMGRFLCKIPYAYLNTSIREHNLPEN